MYIRKYLDFRLSCRSLESMIWLWMEPHCSLTRSEIYPKEMKWDIKIQKQSYPVYITASSTHKQDLKPATIIWQHTRKARNKAAYETSSQQQYNSFDKFTVRYLMLYKQHPKLRPPANIIAGFTNNNTSHLTNIQQYDIQCYTNNNPN